MNNCFLKVRGQVCCSLSDHCLWNGIRRKKRAEVEEVSGYRTDLTGFLKGEGPGSSNRGRIILVELSSYMKDITPTGLIAVQVIR
jgi:hypothetical protein